MCIVVENETSVDARGVHAGVLEANVQRLGSSNRVKRVGERSLFLDHVLDIQQKLERSRRLVCCGL